MGALGIPLLALALMANAITAHSRAKGASTPRVFDTRHSVAAGGTIDGILGRPTAIQTYVKGFRKNGRRYLSAKFDFHAVYPIEMEKIISVIADYDSYADIFPRVEYSRDEYRSYGPSTYHRQQQNLSFRFINIGIEYKYVINIFHEDLGKSHVFATKWYLDESLDDKLDELYGSWYLEEFKERERTYTYVRYYVGVGFKQVFWGLETVMRQFSSREWKRLLDTVYMEAKNRDRYEKTLLRQAL